MSIKVKIHMGPSGEGGQKVYMKGPGHITKISAMPIYVKNYNKNLFFQNQKSCDLETWYIVFGSQASINDDSRLTLTYFTAR